MSYAEVLRQTRLMALPPSLKAGAAHNAHPVSPAIRTSKAAQGMGDWGLKRNLPKLRVDNITISDTDTQEHQTPFKSGNKYSKVVQRWQEMGIPLRHRQRHNEYGDSMQDEIAPPQVGKGIHLGSAPRKQVTQLVKTAARQRKTFLDRQSSDPKIYTQKVVSTLRQAGQEWLGIVPAQSRAQNIQPNAGLAYHPHGALSLINTPDGPKERTLVARHISSGRNNTFVGLGGIVTDLQQQVEYNHASAGRGRQNTLVVYASEADMANNGSIHVSATDLRPDQAESSRSRGISPYLEKFDNRFSSMGDAYAEDDMEYTGGSKSLGAMSRLGALLRSSPVAQQQEKERQDQDISQNNSIFGDSPKRD